MAMADLMGWEAHEKIRQDLMSALTRTPPPGYSRVSKQQVKRADEIAFGLLAKFTENGVKRIGGARPLDEAVDKVLAHRDYNPNGGGDPAKLTEDLLKPLAGEKADQIPMLRMLWWEAWG